MLFVLDIEAESDDGEHNTKKAWPLIHREVQQPFASALTGLYMRLEITEISTRNCVVAALATSFRFSPTPNHLFHTLGSKQERTM